MGIGIAALIAILLATPAPGYAVGPPSSAGQPSDSFAAAFYVSPHGKDENSGTREHPFRSIQRAQEAANSVKANTPGDVGIILRGGDYQLDKPLTISAADSGANGHQVVYKNYGDEKVTVSGGEAITGWKVDKRVGANVIYKANAKGLDFTNLYVDNHPATLARYPNAGTQNRVTGWDLATGSPQVKSSEVPKFSNPSSNPARIRVQARWIDIALPIASMITAGGTTTITGTDPARQPAENMAPGVQAAGNPYYLDNAYEFLDAPGEWYLNKATDTVYYVASQTQSMASTSVIAPKLEQLVDFQGTLDKPVHDITFEGITFADTSWREAMTDGVMWGSWSSFPSYLDGSGAKQPGWAQALANRPQAAILIQDANHITLTRNTIHNTGGTGIFLRESQANSIVGNTLYDIGYHGIQVGIFQNYSSDQYPGVDYEHGTPTDPRVVERDDTISNNYISRVGASYVEGIGIKLGWTSNTVIEHNNIFDVPYSGMMLGNGKPNNVSVLGNIQVRYNDVSRNNTTLSDGAAIYAYAKHSPKTQIVGNYLHDGWYSKYEDNSNILGIYLDDGANGFNVVGNLVSNEVSGYINGGEAEHIANGDTFSGNQPTDAATVDRIISNAGMQPAYQDQRLAPTASRFPGTIRLAQGDTAPLQVKFGYAPGWTVYYTTDGSTPTRKSSIASGYVSIPRTGDTTFRVVAINDRTGQRSQEISGTYVIQGVVYSYSFDGATALAPLIEGHQRSTFVQASTGWRWSAFTPKPADYDPTTPAPGMEWADPDETLYLDTGTGPHIQFSGRATGSGNTAGAYAYSIVSSTGSSTTSDGSLDNLQNAAVEIGSDGGPWPYLPGTVDKAGSPYPEKTRLLMRDDSGVWYLSTADTAPEIVKAGNFTFNPMSTLHWQKLDAPSQSILNSAPNPDATKGAISVEAPLVTPDLTHITGTGIYIDSTANETSFLRFRGMTFIKQ